MTGVVPSLSDLWLIFFGGGSADEYAALLAAQAAGITFLDLLNGATFEAKNAVAYATTGALPANTYNNGASGVGATLTANAPGVLSVDGVNPPVNTRLLIKNEVTAANNGLYGVTAVGSIRTVADGVTNGTATITSATAVFTNADIGSLVTGSADLPAGAKIVSVTNATTAVLNAPCTGSHAAQTFNIGTPYVLARTSDANESDEIGPGILVPVEGPSGSPGTVNDGTIWISVAASPFTIGTTAINFGLVGSAYVAGTGLTLTGNSFSVNYGATGTTAAVGNDSRIVNAASLSSGSQQAFTGEVKAPDLVAAGLTGATAASRYVGATTGGAPNTGTFAVGDFVVDQLGIMWICTTAGTPGTWTAVPVSAAGVAGYVAGAYIAPVFGTITTLTGASGQLYGMPLGVVGSRSFDRISAEVTAAVASTTLRLGIYKHNYATGLPGAKILDAGTINGNSATVQEITINQAVVGPIVWLAMLFEGGAPTVRAQAGHLTCWPGGTAAAAITSPASYGAITKTGVATGSLPDPFPTPNAYNPGPRMAVRLV